jgi:hypothetical protein
MGKEAEGLQPTTVVPPLSPTVNRAPEQVRQNIQAGLATPYFSPPPPPPPLLRPIPPPASFPGQPQVTWPRAEAVTGLLFTGWPREDISRQLPRP